MVGDKLHGCHIPNGAVRPLLIVFPMPGFNDELGFLQREKPMLIQTLVPELPIKTFDKRFLHPLPRLNEVDLHAVLSGPGIQDGAGEFGAVVYAEEGP